MFAQHIQGPYRVYGYLTDVDVQYHQPFHRVIDGPDVTHAEKLDALATMILADADDEDWLLFIDGDAFPVMPLEQRLAPLLTDYPLVAIRRVENLGEKHPHPSFCLTTVRFWKEIHGTWDPGYKWINNLNLTETDVGGALLGALTRRNIAWYPLLRSNKRDVLPVYFGIYGDIVYHHGAGFRGAPVRQLLFDEGVFRLYRRLDSRILNLLTPRKYQQVIRNSVVHPEGRKKRRIIRRVRDVNARAIDALFRNPQAFLNALRTGDRLPVLE
ncbi:MAG: hypothetical protein R3330_13015 [Saprospiraceae bacterium]|nr:hypothetical protein [Saprospiraceae bacterium]